MLGEGMSELRVDQLGQCRPVGFVADVPACSRPAWRRSCRGTIPPSWSGPLIASARIVVSNRFLSLARSPDFRWAKCRVKPVHSSTSSSNSVILTCGRIIAVWSIRACAVSGTAASSGVIFRPDSVMMASGSSLASAMRLTVASCVSSSVSRSCRYWSQSVATASGNSLACLRLANFAGGTGSPRSP